LEDDVPVEWDVGDVILDRYEVTGLLGEGGMGKVYRVHHRRWDLDMAVKSPRPSAIEEIGLDRFIREAEHWVHLGLHQHIVVCYYVRVLGGVPRLFTELVPGGNLAHWIYHGGLYAGGGEAALHRIIDIAIQCAWGLQHAHDAGLVHQDVKPGNILMMADGTAKVCDFGLAEFARVTLTSGSESVTPSYASPEQMSRRPVGQPADVWSWGVTVLEMFIGRYLRWGPGAAQELTEFLASRHDPRHRPVMPTQVIELLRWCFQDSPSARPSMAVVAETLVALYGEAYPRPRPGEIDMRADHLNNRAVSLMDLGDVSEARRQLDEAVLADPWHMFASYNREVLHWRLGRATDEALVERLAELHTARSEGWWLHYLTACVHVERGDQDLAIEALLAAEREATDAVAAKMVSRVRQQLKPGFRLLQTLAASAALNAIVELPDGRVAAVDDGGNLSFWDVTSGKLLRSLRVHHGAAHDLSLSPDAGLAVTAGADNKVCLVDVPHGRVVATLAHKEPVRTAAVAFEGKLIVTGSDMGTLRFWDRRGKLLRTQNAHEGAITRVRLLPSAEQVASVSEDRHFAVWEVGHGEQIHDVQEHSGPVRGLAISSDGQRALTASDDATLRLWDLATGQCVRVFSGHRATVRDVAFTPEGGWAVSVGEDQTARLWEVANGRCARTMRAGSGWLHGVTLDMEGQRAMIASSDMTVRTWQLAWETPRTPPMVVRPRSSSELIDNRLQYMSWLDLVDRRWTEGHLDQALESLIEARQVPGYERSPRCLELWATMLRCSIRVRAQRAWLLRSMAGHHGPMTSVALDNSGDYLVSASEDATLRVWRVATGECLMTLIGQGGPVHRMVLQADGERALSISGEDETVVVWDVPGECVTHRLMGHLRKVRGLAITPNGRVAITAGQEGRVRVWDVETGECTATLPGLGEHLAITPDGRVAALATLGGRVRIYDLRASKCVQVLRGHEGQIHQVALTPDGRLAVSAGEDGTVQVFDLVRGRRLNVLSGHDRSVLCAAVTPDGRHVISGGRDRTLRVWSLSAPEAPLVLVGHGGPVTDVKLNDDASQAVCGSHDGLLRIWHLDWELKTHPVAMWDEKADACLDAFLSQRAPHKVRPFADHIWTDPEFAALDRDLACWGFGWLHPAGARQRVLKVAPGWTGPAEIKRAEVLDED
jgi:WD40 repeat protein